MHAVDLRYRYELLEQVLSRMRTAGVAYDQATYNIMMHACLLRGKQVTWKDWYKRMELAGTKPDSYTYAALVSQLVNNGQWGEALRIIKYMQSSNLQLTSATSASITSMERRRNRVHLVMTKFRRSVLKGGVISVREFTPVICAALENPKMWATEIALIIRCLEDGRVEESAVVDALAARLPGLDPTSIADRPLLRLLRGDSAAVGKVFEDSLDKMASGSEKEVVAEVDVCGRLAMGSVRKSFPEALNAVVQSLLRDGNLKQAEAVVRAAKEASIEINSPHTLVSLLYHTLSAGEQKPAGLSEKIMTTRFVPPTAVPTAMLIHSVKTGNLDAAKSHYQELERLVDDYPSIRAFNAMLLYASAVQSTSELELKWRQMDAKGVVPDVVSHQTRIFCFSKMDDLLKTRRAYTDMLDYGHLPTFPAVSAVVRCCMRSEDVQLAQTIVRHAEVECGVELNTTTYNYILARIADQPAYDTVARNMFASMVHTSNRRVCEKFGDATRDVEREKGRFVDLRVLEHEHARLGSWLMRPEEDRTSSSRLRRALVNWLTSRAAFSAAPTLFDPRRKHGEENDYDSSGYTGEWKQQQQQQRKSRGKKPKLAGPTAAPSETKLHGSKHTVPRAGPPPPNATTFIIMMRANGKQGRWSDVIRVWDTMLEFNRRIDQLATEHAHAESHRIVPFSRMVGWVVLSLRQLGRPDEARDVWQAAEKDGILSESAREQGMEAMASKLVLYCRKFTMVVPPAAE
ncbi:hypothetical protein GQ54DRAFT_298198 [Martensiomyces pterosporus]|nr:hypothetical protein GQ54DRAFT_298198 [Martensiomyces pterosporus]